MPIKELPGIERRATLRVLGRERVVNKKGLLKSPHKQKNDGTREKKSGTTVLVRMKTSGYLIQSNPA